jgi:thiol-disulfide isomerase/thioredoxin
MKTIQLFIAFLILGQAVQAQIPDVEVKDVDKNWISLSDLKGEKLTVVDFWATWCKPCVTSIPKLNNLYSEFKSQGVELIGINVDAPRSIAKVKPFVNTMNIEYPIVLDQDQDLVNQLNVSVFPTLIVFNKKGDEVFVHEGFNPGDEQLIKNKLSELLLQ